MKDYLNCEICGEQAPIPQHCGQAMHIEAHQGKKMLVCWMGVSCGSQEIPHHHGRPMKIKQDAN